MKIIVTQSPDFGLLKSGWVSTSKRASRGSMVHESVRPVVPVVSIFQTAWFAK